jgi:hypothetical protein
LLTRTVTEESLDRPRSRGNRQDATGELRGVLMKRRWRRAAHDATIDVKRRAVTRAHVVLIAKTSNGAGLVRANCVQRHERALRCVGYEEITDGRLHQRRISYGRQRQTRVDSLEESL